MLTFIIRRGHLVISRTLIVWLILEWENDKKKLFLFIIEFLSCPTFFVHTFSFRQRKNCLSGYKPDGKATGEIEANFLESKEFGDNNRRNQIFFLFITLIWFPIVYPKDYGSCTHSHYYMVYGFDDECDVMMMIMMTTTMVFPVGKIKAVGKAHLGCSIFTYYMWMCLSCNMWCYKSPLSRDSFFLYVWLDLLCMMRWSESYHGWKERGSQVYLQCTLCKFIVKELVWKLFFFENFRSFFPSIVSCALKNIHSWHWIKQVSCLHLPVYSTIYGHTFNLILPIHKTVYKNARFFICYHIILVYKVYGREREGKNHQAKVCLTPKARDDANARFCGEIMFFSPDLLKS